MKQDLSTPTLLALVISIMGFSTPAAAGGSYFGYGKVASKTALEGAQEVPSVASEGLANAIISFKRSYREADVRVTYSNLEGAVTRLHLHCAPEGENGPVALGMIDLVALGPDNSETVTLDANAIIGKLDKSQVPIGDANQCGIHSLRSLADEINSGNIYWNLHTTAFPAGELRGQVEPLQRVYDRFAY